MRKHKYPVVTENRHIIYRCYDDENTKVEIASFRIRDDAITYQLECQRNKKDNR